MTHDQLQHDLAESFAGNGEVVIEKLSLGSYGSAGQIDVLRMKLSRTNPNPTCYEVKVSRADFNSDAQKGKYRRYLPYVRRLYFAVPSGLISKGETPAGCGLIVRGSKGWSVVKAAPIHQPDPERWPSLLMSIVLKLHPGPWSQPDREDRIRRALVHAQDDDSLRHLGLRLSKLVTAQIDLARTTIHNEERARKRLAERLGIDPGSPETRDIARLAEEVLQRAPARSEGMVPRSRVQELVYDAQAQQQGAARLIDRLERVLANGGGHA